MTSKSRRNPYIQLPKWALLGIAIIMPTLGFSADYRFNIIESASSSPGLDRNVTISYSGVVSYFRKFNGTQEKQLMVSDGKTTPQAFGARRRYSQFHAITGTGMPITQDLTSIDSSVRTGISVWRSVQNSLRISSSGINERWKQLKHSAGDDEPVESIVESGVHDLVYMPIGNSYGSIAYMSSGGMPGQLKTRILLFNLSERLGVDIFNGSALPLRPVLSGDNAFALSVKSDTNVFLYLPRVLETDSEYRRMIIASAPEFVEVGQSVGISEAGGIVAFVGREPGESSAVYASVPTVGGRELIRVSDPEELADVQVDSRLGVVGPDSMGEFAVLMVGVRGGVRGIYRYDVRPREAGFPWRADEDPEFGGAVKVLAIGDDIYDDENGNGVFDVGAEHRVEGVVTDFEVWLPSPKTSGLESLLYCDDPGAAFRGVIPTDCGVDGPF